MELSGATTTRKTIQVEAFEIDAGRHYQCFGGRPFYPFDPMRSLDCITIETIAAVLASKPRFLNRTTRFYSVAEHSLHVSTMLPDRFQLAGLLHDAHEAFSPFGDVCGPFKPAFIEDMEGELDMAIASKFGFPVEELWDQRVTQADAFMLAQERWWILEPSQPDVDWGEIANIPKSDSFDSMPIPRSASDVREAFEKKLRVLLQRRKRAGLVN